MRKANVTVLYLFLVGTSVSAFAEPTSVEVDYPKQEPHLQSIELSGSIQAKQDAQLAPLEAGVVESIFVEAGDEVKAGDPLLSLDNTLAKLRLSQAQANLSSAQVQQKEAQRLLDEANSLARQKVVSDSLLAERQASLASLNAALTNASAQVALQQEIVKRHTLTAPFSGIIAKRNVDIGEWIGQQSEIFQLVSTHSLRLIVNLPQEHLNSVLQFPNQLIDVIPDVMPNHQLQLPLTKIVPVSESASRTVQIRIDLPDNSDLIPGMSARARFNFSHEDNLLTWLPRSALKRHPDGGHSVFSVKNNKLIRHKVVLIKSNAAQVAVTGVPEAVSLVVSGTEMLTDNQLVTINNNEGNN